jgi:hypothetical protein
MNGRVQGGWEVPAQMLRLAVRDSESRRGERRIFPR